MMSLWSYLRYCLRMKVDCCPLGLCRLQNASHFVRRNVNFLFCIGLGLLRRQALDLWFDRCLQELIAWSLACWVGCCTVIATWGRLYLHYGLLGLLDCLVWGRVVLWRWVHLAVATTPARVGPLMRVVRQKHSKILQTIVAFSFSGVG